MPAVYFNNLIKNEIYKYIPKNLFLKWYNLFIYDRFSLSLRKSILYEIFLIKNFKIQEKLKKKKIAVKKKKVK